MPETKRKLAAILSADVVGYSRLMGADEEATVSALNDCRAIFKTRIAEHHGRVVDTAGDSVLAEFPSVVEAVRTAIEVQDALARRNEVLPEDRRMLFRIGVNVDDVIEQADGSIYGGGVNVAARLEALADPGGICVSASAFERVKGKLDQGFESMGTHDVKNIVEPVQVFRVTPSAGFRGAHVPTHKTSLKRTPARHTSPAVLGLAAAALVTVAAVAWWLTRSTQQPPPRYKLTELTKDAGLTTDPTLSPDGTFVAYASDRGGKGNLDIWTQLVSGGQPIQLTSDEANDYRPSYSGDGSQIAFRSDRDGGGIYLVSATGGDARLLAKGGNLPTFSPDSRWVAYSVGRLSQSCHIYVAPVAGGPSRQVEIDLPWSSAPVWSPSGKELLFLGADKTVVYAATEATLWVAPFEGGKAVKTGLFDVFDSGELEYPGETSFSYAWSLDGRHLVFTASFGDSVNLWRIPISGTTWQIAGEPQQLTGGRQDGRPSVSRGGLLAYSRLTIDFDIWGVEIDANRGEKRGEPTRVTQGTARDQFASVDADGSTLVFMSDRSGNWDVWVKDLNSAKEPRQLTFTPEREWRALISPDGSTAAFARGPYGKVEVYILPVTGGVEKKVADDAISIYAWSSDSKKVLYASGEPVRPSVVDIETGQITHLLPQPEYAIHNSQYSPDDRWLSFTMVKGPEDEPIYIAPLREESVAEQSEWIQITKGPLAAVGGRNWWSPDGQMLYFLAGVEGSRRIWAQPLDPETKEPRGSPFEALTFPGPRFQLFVLAGYGLAADRLYQAVQETNGNIWLAEPVEASARSSYR